MSTAPTRTDPPRTPPAHAALTRAILRRAMPPARRFWPGAVSAFLSEASAVALLATSAWLIVRASEQPIVLAISVAVVGVRLFALTRAVFRYTDRLTSHDAALAQLATTRSDLVRRLIPLAPDELGRTGRGSVLTALVDDVDDLQNLPLRVVQPLLSSALVALGGTALVAVVSWQAALTLLGCLVVAALAAVFWGWASGARAEREIAPARARLGDALSDHLASLDVLAAFGAVEQSLERVREADMAVRRALTRRAAAQAGTAAIVSLLAGVASILAVLVARPQLADGGFDAPAFAVAVLVPMAVFEVFGAVPLAASAWRHVRASAERIADTVPETIPAELVVDGAAPTGVAPALTTAHGDGLSLRDASIRWPGADRHALTGLHLDVAPGERVLVVGSSGAGKTTLAHALVRFLALEAGTYTIGGVDVATLAADDVRLTVGLVEQHPMLFDEDLRQNLLFARPESSDDELLAVLERVGLREWAEARGGLDARVGERGALVSGGQAQRIALARALLRGFPVLVLDEPTAGVDAEASTALLTDLLGATTRDQAVVLISHIAPPDGTIDRLVSL